MVSIHGILRMLQPPSQWGKGETLVLYAYMDGSGSHEGSPVISVSGFVAEESPWIDLDKRWTAILDKGCWPSRLKRFHMFECARGDGEFLAGHWTFAERLALYGELTTLIGESEVRPISASVLIDCFSQIPPADVELLQRPENRLGIPFDLVCHKIVQQVIHRVHESDPNETVGVLFDQDSKQVEEKFSDFCVNYAATFYLGDVFTAFGFGDSRKITPLQAADLLPYGTHHLAQSMFVPGYTAPDFPVKPALWEMLLALARRGHSTAPNGEVVDLVFLKELVRKVKNKEMLPRKQPLVSMP
jgi:hypothetical protein